MSVHRLILPIVLLPAGLVSFQAAETLKPGRLEGRVIDASSGEPVKKAVVILRRSEESGTGAYTDAEGKFTFDDIQPAAYTIAVERDGFIVHPDSEKTVITVNADEKASGITIKLQRTGAVSGRVLDADGEPLVGAVIQIQSIGQIKRRPMAAFGGSTNDRGEYRAFNIKPGKYRLAASYAPREHLAIRMQKNAEAYATTYYPGTAEVGHAAAIEIRPAADLHGYDLRLLRARSVRVRGKVIGPGGEPAGTLVVVHIQSDGRQTAAGESRMAVARGPTGEFELASVLPGKYILVAQGGFNENQKAQARLRLEVPDTDVEGIVLTLAKPQTILGRVIVPEGRTVPQGLIVMLSSRERLHIESGGVAEVSPDGRFTLQGVQAGDHDVVIGTTTASNDLYVSAIRLGDHDALAQGVQVPVASGSLDIILKANGGAIECFVIGKDSKPVPEAHVTLIPDPPRRRQLALSGNCNTDARGTCTIVGITPGEYHLFALEKGSGIDVHDVEAMKELEEHGKPIKIGEGERQRIELPLIPTEN